MKKVIFISILSIFGFKFLLMSPANPEVKVKLDLIKKEIVSRGYNPRWFIISEKRQSWYNRLLPNSAKDSYHLKGKAVDIYVIDINGDGVFNNADIKIFDSCNKHVESGHPELLGAFGTYTTKGYLSSHMIHIDTRGKSKRYNK
jgi:uncharacterized protein YcbK (DUF882 family)